VCWAVILDGALRSNQTLGKHLTTENSTVWHPLGWAGEDVLGGPCATGIGQI
jgi:hypothetical protein